MPPIRHNTMASVLKLAQWICVSLCIGSIAWVFSELNNHKAEIATNTAMIESIHKTMDDMKANPKAPRWLIDKVVALEARQRP